MDINVLHACFAATLDANLDVRNQAEQQLKSVEKAPGFINGCLEIVLEQNVTDHVKKAAAVYLKNRVLKRWTPQDTTNGIDPDEKPVFRERLIPALNKVPNFIRSILVATLSHIVSLDFPAKWPQLLDITIGLLRSDDINDIRTGITCLLEICRSLRYSSKKPQVETLNRLVSLTFPRLLQIGNNIVKDDSSTSGEMMHDIAKIFKMVIFVNLPDHLKNTEIFAGWLALFLSVLKKPYSTEIMNIDEEDRVIHPWVKAKKWSAFDICNVFKRYVYKKVKNPEYSAFSKTFQTDFIPEIFNIIFEQLTLWVEGKQWMAPETQYHVLTFFADCVKTKSSWQLLEPHVQTIISHVIFPLLCPTDMDLETFEEEPEQFITNRVQLIDDTNSPDKAATAFLIAVMKNRTKSVLNSTLQFIQEITSEHQKNPQDIQLARKMDGALNMLGNMSEAVTGEDSPVSEDLESIIMHFIVPDFNSPFGFLRARVCSTINDYASIGFTNEQNIATIYQNVLKCMNDECLPVQVEASLALQPLIREENVRIALSEHIPRVMQHLLNLTAKLDMDALSGVMEEFVQTYSEQLSPFSLQLAQQMTDQFMRLAAEFMDKRNDFTELNESLDDKVMAAIGILNTLSTLVSSLDSDHDTLLAIEHVLLPVFLNVLGHGIFDFFADVLALIENITYSLASIDEPMWEVFLLIGRIFHHKFALDYLEEVEPVMQNYISYGHGTLSSNPAYVEVIYNIYQITMLDKARSRANEKSKVCEISAGLILSEKGAIDETVWRIINIAIDEMNNIHPESLIGKSYLVSLLKVIIAGIYYNPSATLAIINSKGATDLFLNLFIGSSDNFNTVYDIKVGIIGILTLFTLQEDLFNAIVLPSLSSLNSVLVSLLDLLPKAIERRAKIHNGDAETFYTMASNYGKENVWKLNEGNDDDDELESTVKTQDSLSASEEYMKFLKEQSEGTNGVEFWNPNSADLAEEMTINTPLDSFNLFIITRDSLLHMSQTNSGRYQEIVDKLDEKGRKTIEETIQRANGEEREVEGN